MNPVERFVEVAKSGMESVINFSGRLFEGVKSRVENIITGVGTLFEDTTNMAGEGMESFQRKAVKSMVNQFGADFIEVGASMLQEEASELLSAAFKGVNSETLLKALNLPATSVEEQFENLLNAAQSGLDAAQEGIDEHAEQSTSPLRKNACRLASRLIEKGTLLNNDLSKVGKKAIKGFKRELLEAKPLIEKELSGAFFNGFFLPIINFLSNLLKLFFPTEKMNISQLTTPVADIGKKEKEACLDHIDEVEEIDSPDMPSPR